MWFSELHRSRIVKGPLAESSAIQKWNVTAVPPPSPKKKKKEERKGGGACRGRGGEHQALVA